MEHALVSFREREGERWGAEGLWVDIVGGGLWGKGSGGILGRRSGGIVEEGALGRVLGEGLWVKGSGGVLGGILGEGPGSAGGAKGSWDCARVLLRRQHTVGLVTWDRDRKEQW